MRKRGIWMMISSVLPLLLIFVLPLLGIRGEILIFLFLILIYGFHLLMVFGVRLMTKDKERQNRDTNSAEKEEKYEQD
jgi:hypothetical protein